MKWYFNPSSVSIPYNISFFEKIKVEGCESIIIDCLEDDEYHFFTTFICNLLTNKSIYISCVVKKDFIEVCYFPFNEKIKCITNQERLFNKEKQELVRSFLNERYLHFLRDVVIKNDVSYILKQETLNENVTYHVSYFRDLKTPPDIRTIEPFCREYNNVYYRYNIRDE